MRRIERLSSSRRGGERLRSSRHTVRWQMRGREVTMIGVFRIEITRLEKHFKWEF